MKAASFIFLCFSILAAGELTGQDKKYYVLGNGDDANDGLTLQTAWRTLDKISNFDFKAGDSVVLEGGITFTGTIRLTSADNGSPGKPVVITTHGNKKAIISAGDRDGLFAVNTSFLKIVSLTFHGSGVAANKGSGIHFYADDSINTPGDVEILDCDAKGFNSYGIVFGASDKISHKGYQNVRITHCNASENGQAGISSYGRYPGLQHRNFYIANCKAFQNRGIPSKTENHSGNGIVMAMIDGLLIEYCEAYQNGADNRCTGGGPVGIWLWMCKNGIIQHCISHDNYAGLTKDGGGFDIDGGASACILQYNYSYNNEGAGYLLAEFGAPFPFSNNTIRFNISVNDGRKNGYGAITVWGAAKEHSVTNTFVYNNTIYLNDQNVVNGKPAGITLMGQNFENVIIANNIITSRGDVYIMNADSSIHESALLLLHNNYYSYSNQYNLHWGKKKFKTIQAWSRENPAQERLHGLSTSMNFNPQFKDEKYLNDLSANSSVEYFKNGLVLSPGSPLKKKPFALHNHFKILSNTKDYCNNELN